MVSLSGFSTFRPEEINHFKDPKRAAQYQEARDIEDSYLKIAHDMLQLDNEKVDLNPQKWVVLLSDPNPKLVPEDKKPSAEALQGCQAYLQLEPEFGALDWLRYDNVDGTRVTVNREKPLLGNERTHITWTSPSQAGKTCQQPAEVYVYPDGTVQYKPEACYKVG